ncbi:TonB-dependent receptor [Alloacidobacterium sp.]|uniref:TonB-dependent receptor n=1 Tax=Alloacidobacterium sp. TaxID=2951999 RepID=UPI002D36DBA7|nr:TonB-dependent receptor [Alloacidobacterium sp.]HYK34668.1 TonB-dependent receptor [Alloacidobacterium sp.]
MFRKSLITLLVLLLMVPALRVLGQAGATGTILGTITDSTGAVLPNVKVTVTNTATNVKYNTVSSSTGDYTAPSLNPGSYTVSASANGFQTSVTQSFVLAVDQKVRIDMSLKPGAVTETVELTAQAVQLDTDSAALSQEMSGQQVAALPLNGRNFMQLVLVGAGAVTVGGEQGTMRQGQGNAVSINGGRPEGNNYTLDGLVNTDQALVTPAVILSQDAIGEFKVQSGIYPAENGFGASQINLVSRGGTNALHGAIFESLRNNAVDAKPFPTYNDFVAGVPTANPVLQLNQFGFVADGPVYIPKLYDGRNKTFWMANYEGWRMNNGARLVEAVPTPAELSGDFSATTYPAVNGLPGGPLPAYGTPECTAVLAAGYDCLPIDPATGLNDWGTQVPAAAQISRIGLAGVKHGFWGTPTVNGTPEGVNNFFQNIPGPLNSNQQTYRGDQNLGKFGSVFGRYTHSVYVNHTNYNSGSAVYGLEEYDQTSNSWAISHTINFGPHIVNNFRFGRLHAIAPQGSAPPPSSFAGELALTGVFTKFTRLQETWPNIGFGSGGFVSGGGPVNSYSGSDNPNWEFADGFTWIHGSHTIGLGIDYRRWHLIRNLDDDFYGDWTFDGHSAPINFVTCPNPSSALNNNHPLCGTGNAVADMLTGYYNGVGGFVPGPLSPTDQAGNPQDHVFSYLGPYAEDDWKVTPKLSINYGLRWDFRAAAYEASNHFFWLDTSNPQGGLCYADPQLTTNGVAPGVGINGGPILRYCGKVPHPGPKTPFAPRFGVNYRVNDKTVLRGGYGIFFDSFEGREIDDSADIYPYSIRNSLSPTTVAGVPKSSNNLFPTYTTLGPFPETSLSFIAVIESENPLDPYVQSWTLSVQRALAQDTTLEVNYIGTKSTHLLDRRNISQPLQVPAASQAFCQATDPVTGAYLNLDKAPCTVVSRLPYPNFNGFYIDSDFHGYANYNAMNIKFERRIQNLQATAIYTWAKSMDDKSAAAGVGATGAGFQGFEYNHNPNLDYGPSDFSVNQRFVASYVYQLPFGRGQKFANQINRAADLAIGGWQLSGIVTFQSGFPFTVTANDIQGINDSQFMHANVVHGCDIHGNLSGKFARINPACFTQPALGTFGSVARSTLRQPGINNFDTTIGKQFSISERVKFLFKMDTFNTFNHHQYGGDVGGLIVAGSGGNAAISNGVGSSSFGQITQASSPRDLQFSGRITF